MTQPLTLTALAILLGLAACTEPEEGTYPVSGEVCTEDDPVQTLDLGNCVPPAGMSAGAF